MNKSIIAILLLALTSLACRPTSNPNEWVVTTSTCWNEIQVLEAGDVIPRLYTACDRAVVLPATELSAEFKTEVKFSKRLAGDVEVTYLWKITDPREFISAAKTIVSSPTYSDHKIDPDILESIENSIVDKMLKDLIRGFTPKIDAGDIDELQIEKQLAALSAESFKGRGVEFSNLSVNVNLSPQAEEALDVMSALNFYRENGEEELGRKIIEAKAGATHITINETE